MPDKDTTIVEDAETTEVAVVEVVRPDDVDVDEPEWTRSVVIRHVLERQLVAGQSLSGQLVDAATDVTVAVAHAPADVIGEIRGGATLPTALARTGTSVRGVVTDAGGRVRTAVGGYVEIQATLPNAVVVGAADVAETVARAQGTVAASALNAAFALATVASQGGDVREAFGRERRDLGAAAGSARTEVGESVNRARDGIRGGIKDYDELVAATA